MFRKTFQNIYVYTPAWFQNMAWSTVGIWTFLTRYSKKFHQVLKFLEESQWWSVEEQKAYQDERLRNLVRHAYDNCQYYRKVFDELHLRPSDIRKAEDLKKIPVLEKSTIRKHYAHMRAWNWPERRKVRVFTGGTTGTALNLVSDRDTHTWQWAVWWRHRRRFQLDIRDSFVEFAGRPVVPLRDIKEPIWRRNLPMHQTYVSIHHMNRPNMEALYHYLLKRDAKYFAGYPSGLYLFSTYLLDNGLKLAHPPKMTVTGSETLLPHQRRIIQQAFETRVTDQYGASENCGNISECEYHNYHVDMEFGIIEFLPLPGMPDHVRRIVCTGLTNPAMPLIRYNIGDIATLSYAKCPCGRQAPLVEKIDGRIESYIITPDGRYLGRLDFLFKNTDAIEEAQLWQDALHHVTVKIVRSPHFGTKHEKALIEELRKYLGSEIRIELEYLDEIPRDSNGKFRQIVSTVFRDRYADAKNFPKDK